MEFLGRLFEMEEENRKRRRERINETRNKFFRSRITQGKYNSKRTNLTFIERPAAKKRIAR